MRALGLDIGSVRIGVAVSDPSGSVASPLTVLDGRSLASDIGPLARLVEDYEPECLVVGLPLSLSGETGPQAEAVQATAERLAGAVGVPLAYADERLSSAEARRMMSASGLSEKEQRGSVDKVAAALLLQSWLDGRRNGSQESG
ncbi:Holliday junction resolvase RuvX [Anaerosoma tenue]|uniref:Holliday junction resolvase RuvX n=1 Tax=Anaerosoma tenue TaxID=2933588 RepID=UPI002260F06E|nr:Holliday junction resolvase RuvX [Anaerosoma tenue]MCK8114430.1 Holliday junction resolvase RuvX [Anaerosoma tenue]